LDEAAVLEELQRYRNVASVEVDVKHLELGIECARGHIDDGWWRPTAPG
jgi:hypothetical protein